MSGLLNDLFEGLELFKTIDTSQDLGEVNLRFGVKSSFDKASIEAFISYMAIAQLDQFSDIEIPRSLNDIHKSEHFMDIHLSNYFRRLIQQSNNNIQELIDSVANMENVNLNELVQTKEVENLVYEELVNRIAFEREIDLAIYLINHNSTNLLNRSLHSTVHGFNLEFENSNLEFDEFFFNRINKVNFRLSMYISEYDIEMIHLCFRYAFMVPISYKRAIKCYTYLCAFNDLGRKNRVVQKLMIDDILNHGLDLDKQQNVVPDNPIEPEETKKRGPKL